MKQIYLTLKLMALIALSFHPLVGENVTHSFFYEGVSSERSALRKAMRNAIARSIEDLKTEPSDSLRSRAMDECGDFVLTREILDIVPVGEKFDIEIKVTVDSWKLEQYLRKRSGDTIEKAAKLAGNPNIVVAVAPRMASGVQTGEEKLLRTKIVERMSPLIVSRLKDAGFRSVVKRGWITEQENLFIQSTTGIEINSEGSFAGDSARTFIQNVKSLGQKDLFVDFVITAILDVDVKKVGDVYEARLGLWGSIEDTHSIVSLTNEPIFASISDRNASLDALLDGVMKALSEKFFRSHLFEGMIDSWNDQQELGRRYAFGVFYDDDEFLKKASRFLSTIGTLEVEDIDSFRRMVYVTPSSLTRQEMKDGDSLLRSVGTIDGVDSEDFFIRSKGGQFYIAEAGSRHVETINAGLSNSPHLLIEYEMIKFGVKPQSVAKTKPSKNSPQPVKRPEPAPARVVSGDSSLPLEVRLQNSARQVRSALGVVTEFDPKSKKLDTFGTAWAVGPHTWVTNAHVSEGARKKMNQGKLVVILPNRTNGMVIPVVRTQDHPTRESEGTDASILFTDTKEAAAPAFLNLAEIDYLYELDQGEPIFTLGYPMENIVMGGVNVRSPEAVLQTGISVAVTSLALAREEAPDNRIIRHSMPTAGGASGSPIFNQHGDVVGIHFAGNYIQRPYRDKDGRIIMGEDSKPIMKRIPVHGQNLAWRADAILEMLRQYAPDTLR